MIKNPNSRFRALLYAFIRRKMTPITVEEAEQKKMFWAKIYLAAAVCANVYVLYNMSEETVWKKTDAEGTDRKLLLLNPEQPVRVIKYSGFSKVADYRVKDGKVEGELPVEKLSAEPKVHS